jgi:hypothetical protein
MTKTQAVPVKESGDLPKSSSGWPVTHEKLKNIRRPGVELADTQSQECKEKHDDMIPTNVIER